MTRSSDATTANHPTDRPAGGLRPAAVAGMFYPGSARELADTVDRALAAAAGSAPALSRHRAMPAGCRRR